MKQVSLFEAKTHLSNLINHVIQHAEQIAITKYGHTVALLIPALPAKSSNIKEVIKKMQAFSKEMSGSGIKLKDILKMRSEGRK